MSTEFLISFSIIMMMLSLVSERAANFFKLYFQGKILYIPFLYRLKTGWITHLKVRIEILAYKQPTPEAEKEREYRLMVINILIGIVIATLANANFFEIVKQISSSDTTASLSVRGFSGPFDNSKFIVGSFYMLFFIWSLSLILFSRLDEFHSQIKQYVYKYPFILWMIATLVLVLVGLWDTSLGWCLDIVTHSLGYIFVGLFLSLGSKFWHDLLDVLFKLKNTQQVLSDPKTYTDYNNADQLLALAETSRYEVAEKLFDLYKNEIATIPGVVSYGLNTIRDVRTNTFRKIIEVEFTTPEAQEQLLKLQNGSALFLNNNPFYLKDYMTLLPSEDIQIVSGIDEHPVCYAKNASIITDNNRGSFNVAILDNKYYAISNLHVFAENQELKKYHDDKSYVLKETRVQFVVGSETFYGTIDLDRIGFGNEDGESQDFCACMITGELYDAYNNFIERSRFETFPNNKMVMYGATSKYLEFNEITSLQASECNVDYGSFVRKMKLIKIDKTNGSLVQKGDSGSFVYYKIKKHTGIKICKGVIIAKSSNYSYMFRYFESQ